MTPGLLNYLCEPLTKAPLELVDATYDDNGSIQSGKLVSASGLTYPIINGIPRFLSNLRTETVESSARNGTTSITQTSSKTG